MYDQKAYAILGPSRHDICVRTMSKFWKIMQNMWRQLTINFFFYSILLRLFPTIVLCTLSYVNHVMAQSQGILIYPWISPLRYEFYPALQSAKWDAYPSAMRQELRMVVNIWASNQTYHSDGMGYMKNNIGYMGRFDNEVSRWHI